MTTKNTTKKVPAKALRFSIGEFELGDNGENAASAPITLLARTGQPVEHFWWGRVVHDLDGMKLHKDRVAIDYNHDPNQPLGYLNNFDTSSGNLVASGALTPRKKGNDRVAEVIEYKNAGVPYEASINFGGDGIVIEEVAAGASVEVNGYQFEGPGVIFREWPLRGVAVCLYGVDQGTSAEFSQSEDVPITVMSSQQESSMPTENEKKKTAAETSDETTTEEVVDADENKSSEAEQAVDDSKDNKTEQAEDQETDAKAEEAVDAEDDNEGGEEKKKPTDGEEFMQRFGQEKGAYYFAKGMSLEAAQEAHIKDLEAQLEKANSQLSAAGTGGIEGDISSNDSGDMKSKGSGKTSFASLIRIRGRSPHTA